ncbi:MAG: DNA polymerase III subunit beta [Alphaproteobacteria bacterium]
MKVIIERNVLAKSLAHVQGVVERRNTIPILSNVLMSAGDNGLKLTATDLDIEVVEEVPAQIIHPGASTAPAHLLNDIVRKLPDGAQLEISTDPERDQIELRAGRSHFTLPALRQDEFPLLAADDLTHHFTLGAGEVKRLLERTRFAISTEETRYYLNGIYLHEALAEGGNGGNGDGGAPTLRAVATDGHRLAQAELALPDGASGMPGIIVPRKCVGELHKLLDTFQDDVAISVSEAKIRFAFGNVVITSKLIDGTFPDYRRVIPEGNEKLMEVEAKPFAQAVDRVSTVASDKGRAVKMSIDDARLVLSVDSPDAGSAEEEMAVSFGAGKLEIGFNARYLLDVTAQIESEKAHFLFSDAVAPTLVRDPADPAALYVLMPMRV